MVVTGVATTLNGKCTKKKKGKVSFPLHLLKDQNYSPCPKEYPFTPSKV